jgi:hypothetical protein
VIDHEPGRGTLAPPGSRLRKRLASGTISGTSNFETELSKIKEPMNTHELKTFDTLMRQASMTAWEFGDGYAEEHPELLGAYMQTARARLSGWSDRGSDRDRRRRYLYCSW